jgi:hypothetical protein
MGWEGITLGGSLDGIWIQSNIRLVAKTRHFGEAATPKGSAARASSLRIIPGHWSYNCGKKHGKNLSQGSQKVPLVKVSVIKPCYAVKRRYG